MKMDVTDQVDFGNSDDESLPLTKCVCGKKFEYWEFVLSIYEDSPNKCPNCGRKLFFRNSIRVYEVKDENTSMGLSLEAES